MCETPTLLGLCSPVPVPCRPSPSSHTLPAHSPSHPSSAPLTHPSSTTPPPPKQSVHSAHTLPPHLQPRQRVITLDGGPVPCVQRLHAHQQRGRHRLPVAQQRALGPILAGILGGGQVCECLSGRSVCVCVTSITAERAAALPAWLLPPSPTNLHVDVVGLRRAKRAPLQDVPAGRKLFQDEGHVRGGEACGWWEWGTRGLACCMLRWRLGAVPVVSCREVFVQCCVGVVLCWYGVVCSTVLVLCGVDVV